MGQSSLAVRLVLALAVLVNTAFASPVNLSETGTTELSPLITAAPTDEQYHNALVRRDVACDDISTYSVGWFLNNVNYNPPQGTCLFYGSRQGWFARKRASNLNAALTTIWDIWPKRQYRWNKNPDFPDPFNPMRCIFNSPTNSLTYFKAMSTAMAALCDHYAMVMVSNPARMRRVGLFWTHELPEMQWNRFNQGNQINAVDAIDNNGNNLRALWRQGQPRRTLPQITKRDDDDMSHNATMDYNPHMWQKRANPYGDGADAGAELVFDVCGLTPIDWG